MTRVASRVVAGVLIVPALLAPALISPASVAVATTTKSVHSREMSEYPGVGKRVVYSRAERRVWLVRADDHLSATWSVTGHPTLPANGTYTVFSRSLRSKTYDGKYSFGHVARFARSPSGSTIGFHDLPYLTGTSIPIMPVAKIGQPGFTSSGCVRQRLADAIRMYAWAKIGVQVVVID